jgi:hypothetical protein
MNTVESESSVLFRLVGQQELVLIQESQFLAFPPRLPEQPFFYPVITEEYAVQIARDWNAKHNEPKSGYVTRFRVRRSFLHRYEVKTVGGSVHQEYWIAAEDLDELNRNIIGKIEVIAEFRN